MGILKYFLIAVLIVFPFGAVVRIQVAPSAYVYPLDIMLFGLACVSLYEYVLNYRKILLVPYTKALLIFLVIAFLSLLLNLFQFSFAQIIIGSLYLGRFIVYANLLFVFYFLKKSFINKYFIGIFLSGLVIVSIGFTQYFFYPNLRNLYYLGWDEHLYRMFSTFLDPNFVGCAFAIILLMGLYLLQTSKRTKIKTPLLVLSVLATIGAIFLTYSRSAYIMTAVSLFIYFLFSKQKKLILVGIVIFCLGLIFVPKNLSGEGVKLLRTKSISGRFLADQHGLEIFERNIPLGVGFDMYRYSQEKNSFLDKTKWQDIHSGAGVPNSYIFILATTGVLGFIAYMYFWFYVVKSIYLDQTKKNMYARSFMLAIIGGILVDALFENVLFYPSLMILTFILISWYFRIFITSDN
jgi:hypothetical protein